MRVTGSVLCAALWLAACGGDDGGGDADAALPTWRRDLPPSSVMGGVRGLRVLVPLMLNPYAPVAIEKVEMKVDLRFEANYGEVKEIRLGTPELLPGQRNTIKVLMQTWDGKDVVEMRDRVAHFGGGVRLVVSASAAAVDAVADAVSGLIALGYKPHEASRYVPLERLALSPQCGFASAMEGNLLTEDEQWRKLQLVVETARKVWKDA